MAKEIVINQEEGLESEILFVQSEELDGINYVTIEMGVGQDYSYISVRKNNIPELIAALKEMEEEK
jgi:hypothetical protein